MARKRKDWLNVGSGKSYVHRVHRPLQCLIFITPLLVMYQVGSVFHPYMMGTEEGGGGAAPLHVVAFVLMTKFFALFGAAGQFLPLAAVVAILFFWHLARKDPWELDPPLYAGMAGESVLWGVPFFVIGIVVARHGITQTPGMVAQVVGAGGAAGAAPVLPWQTEVVLSVGAGIYEELLFRLIAIIVLNMILIDAMELKLEVGIPIIVVVSAILFSAYHYLGSEPFSFGTFAFRTAFGVYLAGVFVYRGFGIVVGAHTVYDLLKFGWDHMGR